LAREAPFILQESRRLGWACAHLAPAAIVIAQACREAALKRALSSEVEPDNKAKFLRIALTHAPMQKLGSDDGI
jgi:hypothetical protein